MRGKRPYLDFSMRRGSGAGASLTPSACATSMMSGFGGPPPPPVTLTPLAPFHWLRRGDGRRDGLAHTRRCIRGRTLCGAARISTFATANGSPLSAKSRRGSVRKADDYHENS